jgi:hypothetical protein
MPNHETLLTLDEADRARSLAWDRYNAMLADMDYSEADLGDDDPDAEDPVAIREGTLAVVAWRQALTFLMTMKSVLQTGVSG